MSEEIEVAGAVGEESPYYGTTAKYLLGYCMVVLIGTVLICVVQLAARELDVNGTGIWTRPLSFSAVAAWRVDAADISLELPAYGSVSFGEVVPSHRPP